MIFKNKYIIDEKWLNENSKILTSTYEFICQLEIDSEKEEKEYMKNICEKRGEKYDESKLKIICLNDLKQLKIPENGTYRRFEKYLSNLDDKVLKVIEAMFWIGREGYYANRKKIICNCKKINNYIQIDSHDGSVEYLTSKRFDHLKECLYLCLNALELL